LSNSSPEPFLLQSLFFSRAFSSPEPFLLQSLFLKNPPFSPPTHFFFFFFFGAFSFFCSPAKLAKTKKRGRGERSAKGANLNKVKRKSPKRVLYRFGALIVVQG